MSPFLVCSPLLIISGLAPMELGLDILKKLEEGGGWGAWKKGERGTKNHFTEQEN